MSRLARKSDLAKVKRISYGIRTYLKENDITFHYVNGLWTDSVYIYLKREDKTNFKIRISDHKHSKEKTYELDIVCNANYKGNKVTTLKRAIEILKENKFINWF